MPIDVSKLVELFDDQAFRDWMSEHAPDGLGVIDNAKKMDLTGPALEAQVVGVYSKIYNSPLQPRFKEFILQNFSHVATPDNTGIPLTARLMLPGGPDPNKIFSCYSPDRLRWPMQVIFKSTKDDELKLVVLSFTSRLKHAYDTLTIGQYAYAEYIPASYASIVDDIPDKNWEIKQWKTNRK